jgi:hypothetical protein
MFIAVSHNVFKWYAMPLPYYSIFHLATVLHLHLALKAGDGSGQHALSVNFSDHLPTPDWTE